MGREVNDLSHNQTIMLMTLIAVKNSNHLTKSELARHLGVQLSNPLFLEFVRIAEKVGGVEVVRREGPTKYLFLHHKLLKDWLWEQKDWDRIASKARGAGAVVERWS